MKCFRDCNDHCNKIKGICGSCAKEKYGTYGNQKCPKNCESSFCKRDIADCGICKVGYRGEKCEVRCPDHCEYCDQSGNESKTRVDQWYGVNCELNCPLNCGENGSCDIGTGSCNVCPGYYWGMCPEMKVKTVIRATFETRAPDTVKIVKLVCMV